MKTTKDTPSQDNKCQTKDKQLVDNTLDLTSQEKNDVLKDFFVMGWENAHHYISVIKCILQSIKGYLD